MLEEVSISNYKSIRSQRFKLGRISVFTGPDGSGKTNMLEAIGMASAAHDNALDTKSLLKRGINTVKPSLTFHPSSESKEIEVAWYEKSSWKKSKLVSNDSDDNNPAWKEISWYEPAYIVKINNLISTISDGSIDGEYPFPDEERNAILNAAFKGSRVFREYLIYNINMDALQGKTNESKVIPLGIFGERLDILLSSFTEVQIQELNSFGLGSFTDNISTSDNLPALFYLILFFERRTPSFFAIDNIDSLIPPDLCSNLINTLLKLATKNKKQVLITMSNPDILKGLDFNDRDLKRFVMNVTDDGQTIVKEMTD